MDLSVYTDTLSENLMLAIKDVVADATDPRLTQLTIEIATHAVALSQLPDGPDKQALIKENRGALKVIAERHRIGLSRRANRQLQVAVDTGIGILSQMVISGVQ